MVYKVYLNANHCSVSFHLFLPEFDIPELRPQLSYWSSKYQGVERSNLQGISCRPRFVNDLPYTVFGTVTLYGFNGAVNLLAASMSCLDIYLEWPHRQCVGLAF